MVGKAMNVRKYEGVRCLTCDLSPDTSRKPPLSPLNSQRPSVNCVNKFFVVVVAVNFFFKNVICCKSEAAH